MRHNRLLVLCWFVMFGNVLIAPAVSAAAASRISLRWAAIPAFIVELLSFCCAFILRRRIVKAIRPSESSGGQGPLLPVKMKGSVNYSNNYASLCWIVMFGNALVATGVFLTAICYPHLWSVANPACIIELLSFYCAFIMERGCIFDGMP
jgi:hypothetical protein